LTSVGARRGAPAGNAGNAGKAGKGGFPPIVPETALPSAPAVRRSDVILDPRGRSPAIRAAVDDLSKQGESERGAVYTRDAVVEAILTLVRYTAERPLAQLRLLEPSLGAGDFFLRALDRLLTSFSRHGGGPGEALALRPALRGVEIHPPSLARCRQAVRVRLLDWGAPAPVAEELCDAWLIGDDFLLTPLPRPFDVVIGNPPYVRQERIPGPLLAEYRRRYPTIYGRADLYIPFFERGLASLSPGGRLGFICANRWMKNRYGRPLRAMIAEGFAVEHVIDMEDTDAFTASVLAYPAITVIRRRHGEREDGRTRFARRPEVSAASLQPLVEAMLRGGTSADPRVEELDGLSVDDRPWLLQTSAPVALLRRLERRFPAIEEAGLRVGIGVASGADRIMVGDLDKLPVEKTRKLPLVMAADLVDGELRWRGRGIVNPYEADGSLASLSRYRRFAAYLRGHEETLRRRYIARRGGAWYRTIDRIDVPLTTTPKLLIPDIKGAAMVVYDEGRFYPHHNLYYVVAEQTGAGRANAQRARAPRTDAEGTVAGCDDDTRQAVEEAGSTWDLQALATVLRSSIALLFIDAYSVKLSGGFLRFQAQYLRRIRVPRWESLSEQHRTLLAQAPITDRATIDRIVFSVYGLTSDETAAIAAWRRASSSP